MPGTSTITAPITSRVAIEDVETLRLAAQREGTTVSEIVRRLVREVAPRLAT